MVVNDILDVSKMEAGKLVMNEVPFSLRRELDKGLQPLGHAGARKMA